MRENETPPKLTAVTCAITDAAGRSLGTFDFAQESSHPGTWSNPSLFRIEAGMPRGVWHAEITGLRADGRTETARFEFLVTDPWPQGVHPRLYFREENRDLPLSGAKSRLRRGSYGQPSIFVRAERSPSWPAIPALKGSVRTA